ncbi:hypothetical protein NPIL_655461 [Nephila pilipes]|uniref:Uncharacterized protein n=1 Tax=Nephila pilipes TaxID=299642 RepID=A0A8X6M7X5_NEPPI|nr:hypothetical protein NPIL_655461 [Nephila pilipes]
MDDQLLDLLVALSPERLEHKYPFPRHPLSGNLFPSPLNSGKPGLADCRKKIDLSCRGKFLTLSWLQLILSYNFPNTPVKAIFNEKTTFNSRWREYDSVEEIYRTPKDFRPQKNIAVDPSHQQSDIEGIMQKRQFLKSQASQFEQFDQDGIISASKELRDGNLPTFVSEPYPNLNSYVLFYKRLVVSPPPL